MIEWWNKNKTSRKVVLHQIQTLTMKIKGRGNAILSSFGKAGATTAKEFVSCDEPVTENLLVAENVMEVSNDDCQIVTQNVSSSTFEAPSTSGSRVHTPVQLKVKESLLQIDSELVTLMNARDSGLSLSLVQANRLKSLKNTKEESTKKLKRLQCLQLSSQKHREKVKQTVNRLRESNPEAANDLQAVMPQTVGRPRLERDQPDLMDTIIRIVTHHSSADERRRTETLRSIRTLNGLMNELKLLGLFVLNIPVHSWFYISVI